MILHCAGVGDCLWNGLLVASLAAGLRWLFQLTGSWGLAIMLFTVAVRTLLFPLSVQQVRSQRQIQALQPLLTGLRQRYSKQPDRLAQEQTRLYREHGVNPAAGCLPVLVQMPLLFAFYAALRAAAVQEDTFRQSFLWVRDLAQPDAISAFGTRLPGGLPLLAGGTQWLQGRMSTAPTDNPQQRRKNQLLQVIPLMVVFFGTSLSAGIALYWVTSTLVGIVQAYLTTGWGSLRPARRSLSAGILGRWVERGVAKVPVVLDQADGGFQADGYRQEISGVRRLDRQKVGDRTPLSDGSGAHSKERAPGRPMHHRAPRLSGASRGRRAKRR